MPIQKRKEFIISVVYFALIAVMVYLSIKYLLGLLFPFIIGLGVAALLYPATRAVSKWANIPRKIVAVLFVVLFYAALCFVFSWMGIHLFTAVKGLLFELPQLYSSVIEPALNTFFYRMEKLAEGLEPSAAQVIRDLAGAFSGSAGSIVSSISTAAIQGISTAISSIPRLIITIIFALISTLFFAVDYDRITDYIRKRFSGKANWYARETKAFAFSISSKYIKGYSLLLFITFLELFIGLTILGIEKPLYAAAMIALIDLLPVLGTGAILIPWISIEFISGNSSLAIGLLALYLVIITVRGVLEPKIVGQQIGLHPVVMLICIFVGAKVFGIGGMIALPICAVAMMHFFDQP
jgi:sporulation integral membrane protein YtvI